MCYMTLQDALTAALPVVISVESEETHISSTQSLVEDPMFVAERAHLSDYLHGEHKVLGNARTVTAL
jgi:hypothetical protein